MPQLEILNIINPTGFPDYMNFMIINIGFKEINVHTTVSDFTQAFTYENSIKITTKPIIAPENQKPTPPSMHEISDETDSELDMMIDED